MADPRTTIPTAPGEGPSLEVVERDTGVYVPTVALTGLDADGDIVDLNAESGVLRVSDLDAASETTLASIEAKLPALVSGRIPVDVGSATINVDVSDTNFGINNFPSDFPDADANTKLTNISNQLPSALVGGRLQVVSPTSGFGDAQAIGASLETKAVLMAYNGSTYDRVRLANATGSLLTETGGIWYDDTATILASSGTFTGTSRDLVGAASAALGGPPEKFKALSASDVSGTLHLEVSRDNSVWRRVASKATTQVGGSGLWTAEIVYDVAWRYARLVYINNATAQAHFTLGSLAQ